MRRGFLVKSLQGLLPAGEELISVVYMWKRHRLMLPYGALAFVALFAVAWYAGFDKVSAMAAVGAAGAVIAVTATTTYRVLGLTSSGLVLCEASRVRQVAKAVSKRLPADTQVSQNGGNMIASDWLIGPHSYTVSKSSEPSMLDIHQRLMG